MRCRVLHFFMPADETAWFTVQRRGAWVAAPFFLVSWAGVQVWSFIALYLLIDKRDEFQVVNWVTTFKLFQFVFTGVAPFVWICFRVVRCAREKNAKESAARKRVVTHNPHIGVFGTWGKTDKKRQLKSLVG